MHMSVLIDHHSAYFFCDLLINRYFVWFLFIVFYLSNNNNNNKQHHRRLGWMQVCRIGKSSKKSLGEEKKRDISSSSNTKFSSQVIDPLTINVVNMWGMQKNMSMINVFSWFFLTSSSLSYLINGNKCIPNMKMK